MKKCNKVIPNRMDQKNLHVKAFCSQYAEGTKQAKTATKKSSINGRAKAGANKAKSSVSKNSVSKTIGGST